MLMHEGRIRRAGEQHVVDGWKLSRSSTTDAAISSASARDGATHMAINSPT